MVEVIRARDFDVWLTKLKDRAGRLRILRRIDRLANGNPGDAKSVGSGVLELAWMSAPATASTTRSTVTC